MLSALGHTLGGEKDWLGLRTWGRGVLMGDYVNSLGGGVLMGYYVDSLGTLL